MTKDSLRSRLAALKDRSTLQLTTFGRKTGKRHTVTVWFLVEGETVYLVTLRLRRDWPRNVLANGRVELDINGQPFTGRATPITDGGTLTHVKVLLADKYWAAWVGSWFGQGPEGAFKVKVTAT